MGGFKVQGKSEEQARAIIEDALMLQEGGVFAIVLECVPAKLAKLISEKLSIPTIGIGAGNDCDGQVLVMHDMAGMYSDMVPKFAKRYALVGEQIEKAAKMYIQEVQEKSFPEEKHTFKIDDETLSKLY